MIERIVVENLRCHARTELTLDTRSRLTVLVGPNGAGKTSLLKAIMAIRTLGTPLWESMAVDLWSQRRQGTNGMAITVHHAGDERFALKVPSGDHWEAQAQAGLSGQPEDLSRLVDANTWQPSARKLHALSTGRYFHLHTTALAASVPVTAQPIFEPDGSGLADTLAHIQGADSETFERIETWLRAIVPTVERVRFAREDLQLRRTQTITLDGTPNLVSRLETVAATSLLIDTKQVRGVSARAMSEGTLYALGIATALGTTGTERLLLLDGLEQGLHPQAQWELVGILRRALELAPELQIIAATHSRDLVDRLAADEVRVLALRPDESTALRPLTELPGGEDVLSTLFPGEAWASQDESWVCDATG